MKFKIGMVFYDKAEKKIEYIYHLEIREFSDSLVRLTAVDGTKNVYPESDFLKDCRKGRYFLVGCVWNYCELCDLCPDLTSKGEAMANAFEGFDEVPLPGDVYTSRDSRFQDSSFVVSSVSDTLIKGMLDGFMAYSINPPCIKNYIRLDSAEEEKQEDEKREDPNPLILKPMTSSPLSPKQQEFEKLSSGLQSFVRLFS